MNGFYDLNFIMAGIALLISIPLATMITTLVSLQFSTKV